MLDQIINTGVSFSKRELLPEWNALDSNDSDLRKRIISAAAKNGIFSFVINEKLGGSGFGILEFSLFIEQISEACPGAAMLFVSHMAGITPLLLSSDNENSHPALKSIADREQSGAICAVSLAAMENAHDFPKLETICASLVENESKFLLQGSKHSVIGASYAAFFVVLAKISEKDELAWAIVPADSPGVGVSPNKRTTGLRLCPVCDVTFESVEVTPDNVLPATNEADVMRCYDHFMGAVASIAIGASRKACEIATKYSLERYQGGKFICDHGAVRDILSEMNISIEMMANPVSRSRRILSAVNACRVAEKVCLDSIQILGGYGYMTDFKVERFLRDVITLRAIVNPLSLKAEFIIKEIERYR